jgi:hypothetical protein
LRLPLFSDDYAELLNRYFKGQRRREKKMFRKSWLLAVVLSGALWLSGQTRPGPFVGVVTCTMCGARHTMGIKPDSSVVSRN